jgi:hypothetical protein
MIVIASLIFFLMVVTSLLLRRRNRPMEKSLLILSILCTSLSLGIAFTLSFMEDARLRASLPLLTLSLGTFAIGIDEWFCADFVLVFLAKYLPPTQPTKAWSSTTITVFDRIFHLGLLLLSFLFFAGFWFVIRILSQKH